MISTDLSMLMLINNEIWIFDILDCDPREVNAHNLVNFCLRSEQDVMEIITDVACNILLNKVYYMPMNYFLV